MLNPPDVVGNFPLVTMGPLPLLRRHFCGFPQGHLRLWPNFHGFVRAAILWRALATVCVFFPSIRPIFEISRLACLMCFVRTLVLICHCKPLERIITCVDVVFSVDNSCRITPHVQKLLSFCIEFFALCALHRLHLSRHYEIRLSLPQLCGVKKRKSRHYSY